MGGFGRCAKNKMRIVNEHKYCLRWWMVLAAIGIFALAIDSASEGRWLNAIVFIFNSYWLLTLHRLRNSSRITKVERDEAEIVVFYACLLYTSDAADE